MIPGLRDRLADVRARIARAASRAGRDPSGVRLVAVSKTFPAEAVRAAADLGQVDFGENKVQEALAKMAAVQRPAASPVRWHLIGHLQSNKARKAAENFDVIHSVDSPALLSKIDEAARAANRRVDVLIQADLAGEETKHGAATDQLASIFETARTATHAHAVGLMLLPPAVENPDDARPYFRALHSVRERLRESGVDGRMLTELSMGMSHDFEVAIEEGATIVRVGTAIFGSRTYV